MAKNLTTFAPGMRPPSSNGESEWCVMVFGAGGGENGNTNIRNYGGHGFQWTAPTGVTTAKFHVVGQGSGGGGINCCGYGPGGNGGGSAVIDVNPTSGQQWCFCMASAATCNGGNAGNGGCKLYVYDVTNTRTHYTTAITPGQCTQCNYYVTNNCEEVCFNDNFTIPMSFDNDKSCLSNSRYGCKEEYITSPFYNLADSDVNMFKSRAGYTISTCCYVAAAHCGMTTMQPRQHWKTDKSHYIGSSVTQAENNTGQSHRLRFESIFGGHQSNTYGNAGVCDMGGSGMSAIANGGNCYCGSTGPRATVTIYYK